MADELPSVAMKTTALLALVLVAAVAAPPAAAAQAGGRTPAGDQIQAGARLVALPSADEWRRLIERRFGRERIGDELGLKATVVGAPELDAVHGIDRDEVRRRLGLPADQPIVLYLPFPLRSNMATTWLRHVYTPSTRIEQGMRMLLADAREYWPHVVNGWNDRRLVEAVRRFCDRNGAMLVMKARRKDPLPRYAERLADRAFYDPSHYPPTILELLSVASLCVHFYSTTALEAAYCGVPSLCLAPAEDELGPRSRGFGFIHNGDLDGIYNTPGVSYWRPLTAAFDGLDRWQLSDFPLDANARRSYVERFLGFDDGRSSARLLDDVLEPALGRRLSRRSTP